MISRASPTIAFALLIASACSSHPHHPGDSGERCLSPAELLDVAARAEDTTPQQAEARLMSRRLRLIHHDLVAAHHAATARAPVPVLESGACVPDELELQVIFTGDEKPLAALASAGFYATDPQAQTGLREAVARFPTKNLAALLALPNVQRLREPDPGRTTLGDTRYEGRASERHARHPRIERAV